MHALIISLHDRAEDIEEIAALAAQLRAPEHVISDFFGPDFDEFVASSIKAIDEDTSFDDTIKDLFGDDVAVNLGLVPSPKRHHSQIESAVPSPKRQRLQFEE